MDLLSWKFSVLLITSIAFRVNCLEPKCSEFHFLENLLEKMIRMENKMDTFVDVVKKDIENTRNKIREQEDETRNVESTLKTEIEKLKTDIGNNAERISDTFAGINVTLRQQAAAVAQGSKFLVKEPIAFLARLDEVQKKLEVHQIIKFDVVVTNLGNGYDASDGIFTAPVQGIYLFSTSAMSYLNPTGRIEADIMQDGKFLSSAYAQSGEHLDQGSVTVVTQLAAGNKVWVRVRLPKGGASMGAWGFSTFTGCLLISQ